MRKTIKVILFNVAVIALILALFEGAMYALLRQPALLKHCPKGIRNSMGYLYSMGERRVIQFSPECARYDEHLGYTLKPGSCLFSGTEFSNQYSINKQGLRDSEESLHRPDVIVAGDSYAMGWAVDQTETFAKVLAQKSGLRILNSAIASYGTAREMLLLGRLDTSQLKYLVVQYCENDLAENRTFLKAGNRLETLSRQEYEHYTAVNNEPKDYTPGKYLVLKIDKKLKEWRQSRGKKAAAEASPADRKASGGAVAAELDEVDCFLQTLMNGPVDLSGVQIIVLEAVGKGDFDRPFIGQLTQRIRSGPYPDYIRKIIPLDITKVITPDHYYLLDDHWTPAGHRAIAEALLNLINPH